MDILSYVLSKKYTDNAVNNIANFKVHVVESLPTSGVANTFYLISSAETSNSTLYIWAENTSKFEIVGTTELTLSNYYTKDEVTALLNNVKVDLTGYATESWVTAAIEALKIPDAYDDTELRTLINNKANSDHTHDEYALKDHKHSEYLTEHQSLEDYAKKSDLFSKSYNDLTDKPEIPSIEGLATENYVKAAIAEAELSGEDVDLSGYATKDYVAEEINKIEFPEAELYKVDFNAPNYADAKAAYESGKLLVLINAAPDAESYAVMNYANERYITFTKFLTSRSEAYGSFNTYYLSPTNTWEVSKEVRLNKVEANPNEESVGELTKVRIGKEIYSIPQAPSLEGYATETYVDKAIENISIKADNTIGIDFITDITVGHLEAGTEIKATMSIGEILRRILVACTHDYGDWVIIKEAEIGVAGERQKTCKLCGHVVTEVIPALEPEEPQGITYLSGTFGNIDVQEWPEPYIETWEPNEQDEISMHYVNNMLTTTVESENDLVGRHGFVIKTPFVKESNSLASYGDTSTDPYFTNPAILLPAGYKVVAWNTDVDNSSLSEQVVNSYTLTDGRIVYYTPTYSQQTGATVTHYLTITKN